MRCPVLTQRVVLPLSAYARATRCPVLTLRMALPHNVRSGYVLRTRVALLPLRPLLCRHVRILADIRSFSNKPRRI
eukprot:37176-Rhodomonas_salina.1